MARSRGVSRGFLQLQENEPLRVLGDLLGDVGDISRSSDPATIGVVDMSQQSPIDTNVLAAFSTMIEIREESE